MSVYFCPFEKCSVFGVTQLRQKTLRHALYLLRAEMAHDVLWTNKDENVLSQPLLVGVYLINFIVCEVFRTNAVPSSYYSLIKFIRH